MSNDDRIPSMDALGRLDDGVLARLHPGIGSLVSREFGIAPVTRLPLGHSIQESTRSPLCCRAAAARNFQNVRICPRNSQTVRDGSVPFQM